MKVTEILITPNRYSRPGKKLQGVKGLVFHWVGNPKSTAIENRNYFDSLKVQTGDMAIYASAHYVAGFDGEIIRCLPEDEMAYHVGAKEYTPLALMKLGAYPNNRAIGIEMCHTDASGKFDNKTLESVCELAADICWRYGLKHDDLYRHYDITGKLCPKYWVDYPEEWSAVRRTIFDLAEYKNKEGRGA